MLQLVRYWKTSIGDLFDMTGPLAALAENGILRTGVQPPTTGPPMLSAVVKLAVVKLAVEAPSIHRFIIDPFPRCAAGAGNGWEAGILPSCAPLPFVGLNAFFGIVA